jgi:dephospho-CoA kinase
MKRIYITGNIGSGKSSATKVFEDKGYQVISADLVSEKILFEYKKEVSKLFKISIKDFKDFKDFKKELGRIIFSDSEKKKILESFLVCKILIEIEHQATVFEMQHLNFVIEAPTYFEVRKLKKGKNDLVILVTAPEEIRMERILKRNPNLTKKEIYNRILSQLNENKKEELSDYVVSNIDRSVFEKEIIKIIERLQEGGVGY